MPVSRKDAHKLSGEALRMGATVMGGQLRLEDGAYIINKSNLSELLEQLEGQNVLLVIGEVKNVLPDKQSRTCLTCGREYQGKECPRCANARYRLRGER